MTRISKIITLFLTSSLLTLSSYTFAQGGEPDPCGEPHNAGCCDGDGNYDPSLPTCPIDGGLTALLIAGVGYGLKRVKDARRLEHK